MLTVEIEHVDAAALERVVEELDIEVQPTPNTLKIIQVNGSLEQSAHKP